MPITLLPLVIFAVLLAIFLAWLELSDRGDSSDDAHHRAPGK